MKALLATSALAGILAFAAAPANAALILMVDGTTVADNGAGDLNAATGVITFSGGAPNFNISVNTGIATSSPSIDLSNVLGQSTGAGTLVIKLTNTGLTSPIGIQNWLTQFTGNVSGGSATVQAQTYIDTTNVAFGTGTLLGNFTANNTPFALSSNNAGGGTTPFSLTEVVTITTTGANRNFSLDTQLSLVPEPATMTILGTSLAGLALARRRRAKH